MIESLECNKEIVEALELGKHIVGCLIPPPHFLPIACALLFFSADKLGVGVGLCHGHGFIITRLAENLSKWSMPIFVAVEEIDCCFIGYSKTLTLCGVFSKRALMNLLSGKLLIGAEYSFSSNIINKKEGYTKHHEIFLNSEFCAASIDEMGLMVDIGMSALKIRIDERKNQNTYGEHATVDAIRQIAAPPYMDELSTMLLTATHAAFVDSFEISNDED